MDYIKLTPDNIDKEHINCFWVSGSCKGKGYSNDLIDACIEDAKLKGKKGLTVISSPKKMSFLSDPKYLIHKGFIIADILPTRYYQKRNLLLYTRIFVKKNFVRRIKDGI